MARANRHYIPGCVWHITHRCHKQEFLLKFAKERKRYLHWLFEAKKRFGLKVLDYMVTSNHIHLLVQDDKKDVIAQSMQLVAGRTGQEYNKRKQRKGAFWEDRYHATAVESGRHLYQCLAYIDMNMVRAGVVQHPREWEFGGYNEIQDPPKRYTIIDQGRLAALCGIGSTDGLQEAHREWVDKVLDDQQQRRESFWSESIAVGSTQFIDNTKERLGHRGHGRSTQELTERHTLREPESSYHSPCTSKKSLLRPGNMYLWGDCRADTDS